MSTVTYTHPVAGSTPPTAAQASRFNLLTAMVAMADGDTLAVVTHNWRLSSAKLAKLFPLVSVYRQAVGTAPDLVAVALTNSLVVTLTKAAGTGTGATLVVILQRPHTIVM